MPLENTLKDNLIKAMKNKDALSLDTLRGLKAVIMNYKIEKRVKEITDNEFLKIVKSEIKKRKDSIEAYQKGNRQDLAQKEEKELALLSEYLPAQISNNELKTAVENKIKEMGEVTKKDFGRIMGMLSKEYGDRADNGEIAKILQGLLP